MNSENLLVVLAPLVFIFGPGLFVLLLDQLELPPFGAPFIKRSTVSLFYDRFRFDYDDFRDITAGGTPGEEPLYGFDADVLRVFFSGWF